MNLHVPVNPHLKEILVSPREIVSDSGFLSDHDVLGRPLVDVLKLESNRIGLQLQDS